MPLADRARLYLVVLQGYGPTISMYTARDRTIGILFVIS